MVNEGYLKKILYLVVVGFVIIFFLIKSIGVGNALGAIKGANKKLFLIATFIQPLILVVRSFRWKILLKDVEMNIPFKDLFTLTLAGAFVNNITPGARVGGEPLRVYWLNRKFNIKVGEGLATVVIERIFDFFVLSILAIIGYFYVIFGLDIGRQNKVIITVLMAVMILLLSGVIKVIFSETVAMRIFNRLPKRFKVGFIEAFWSFRESSVSLIKEGNLSISMILLTIPLWFIDILRTLILFYSFNLKVSFLAIAMVLTLTLFLATIPLLPGGLGMIEGIMVGLYLAIGVPLQISVMVTILDRLISYWLMIILGGMAVLFAKLERLKLPNNIKDV